MQNNSRSYKIIRFILPSVVIITLVFLSAFSYFRATKIEGERASGRVADILEEGKDRTTDVFDSFVAEAEGLGFLLSRTGFDSESIRGYLGDQIIHTVIDACFVYDDDGGKIYGLDELDEPFKYIIDQIQIDDQPQLSDVERSRDGKDRFAVAIAYTTQDGDRNTLMLVYDQSVLTDFLTASSFNSKGRMALVREDGSFAATPKNSEEFFPAESFTPELVASSLGELTTIPNKTGEEDYVIYGKRFESNQYILICSVPKQVIYFRAQEVTALILALTILAMIFFGVVLWGVCNEMKKWNRKLIEQKEKLLIAVSQSSKAVYEYVNRTNKFSFIGGSDKISISDESGNISLSTIMARVSPEDRDSAKNAITLLNTAETSSTVVRMLSFDNNQEYRWYHITGTRISSFGGGSDHIIGSIEDIDERQNERLYLRKNATTDYLTGLLNRAEIERATNEHLSALGEDESSCFIILDLDDFKHINDCFGHYCGDKALHLFGEKIRSVFRSVDIIGRLGGDEFVICMVFTGDKELVDRRLDELTGALKKHRSTDEAPEVSYSAGYVMTKPGDDFSSIYIRADEDLYRAKQQGKKSSLHGKSHNNT